MIQKTSQCMYNSEKNLFFSFLSDFKKDFENIINSSKSKTYHIISHFDTDGITSCFLFNQYLKSRDICAKIIFVPFLHQKLIDSLDDNLNNVYFFLDLGSNNVQNISNSLSYSKIYIFDHHSFNTDFKASNITIINPYQFFKNSKFDLSACGVIFYFLLKLDSKYKRFAYLAVLSAVGEKQGDMSFLDLTENILQIAINDGQIHYKQELNIPNDYNKFLPKALSNKNNSFLSRHINSFNKAFNILDKSMVHYRLKDGFKTYNELSSVERDKLISTIKTEFAIKDPESLFCQRIMADKKTNLFSNYDLSENSTILNAFGKEGLALQALDYLDTKLSPEHVEDVLKTYKNNLYSYFSKIKEKDKDLDVFSGKGYFIVNFNSTIPFNFTGVIASILSYSFKFKSERFILVIGHDPKNSQLKISLRHTNKSSEFNMNLTKILKQIVGDTDWVGGHEMASGAIANIAQLDKIISDSKKLFKTLS